MFDTIRPGLFDWRFLYRVTPESGNSYVFKTPDRNLIVDTGMNRGMSGGHDERSQRTGY